MMIDHAIEIKAEDIKKILNIYFEYKILKTTEDNIFILKTNIAILIEQEINQIISILTERDFNYNFKLLSIECIDNGFVFNIEAY